MPVSLTADIQQRAKASAAGRFLATGATDSTPYPWRELTAAEALTAIGFNPAANSASEIVADFRFQGLDSGGNLTPYARWIYDIASATDGAESGRVWLKLPLTDTAGADRELMKWGPDTDVVIFSTKSGAASSPSLILQRDNPDPQAGDNGPQIILRGTNDEGASVDYVLHKAATSSVIAGEEEGTARILRRKAGVETVVFRLGPQGTIIDGLVRTGSGTPVGNATPNYIGDQYRDTTNDQRWEAKGLTPGDWFLVGGGAAGDAAPTVVEFAASGNLTSAQRAANNVQVHAGAASIDFNVPINTVGAWIIRAYDKDDDTPRAGCTVSVAGDVGEVNDSASGSREITPGGTAMVTSTGGPTPSVKVTGNIFEPDASRGATTLNTAALIAADHQRSITITGTQTISLAVASIQAGFTAVYWASGANRTIDGLDANTATNGDFEILDGGCCVVHKNAAGALVAVGAGNGYSRKILDAA